MYRLPVLKLAALVLDLQPSSPRKVFEMWRVCLRHCIARTYGTVWQVTTCLCHSVHPMVLYYFYICSDHRSLSDMDPEGRVHLYHGGYDIICNNVLQNP